MSDKAMLEVMSDILGALTDANPWGKAVYSDPMVCAADKEYSIAFDELKAKYGEEEVTQIDEAHGAALSAYVDAAVLYGMRVMNALNDTIQNPSELGQYTRERINQLRRGGGNGE